MFRSSMNKIVGALPDSETILIPISVGSHMPEIIDLAHGNQTLRPGYYYVLRSDIMVGPHADFIVVKQRQQDRPQ